MNEQLRFLIRLQEIDSSISSIVERIEEFPNKLERWKLPLKKANDSLLKIKTRYEELNKNKKEKDLELEEIQEKINKLKLRTGEIKTNKEYEAHLKEIGAFEKTKYELEDELLSLMEVIEGLTEDLQKEGANVKKAEVDFKQEERRLEEEKKRLLSDMEMDKTKRKDFVAQIEGNIYEQYMTLLKRLGELAVVQAKDEVCLGCNTNIPPQLYNEIRRNDKLPTCYYCHRFLFYSDNSGFTGANKKK